MERQLNNSVLVRSRITDEGLTRRYGLNKNNMRKYTMDENLMGKYGKYKSAN
jgi:hypothetical protein